jgi:L-rhamnose isomerase
MGSGKWTHDWYVFTFYRIYMDAIHEIIAIQKWFCYTLISVTSRTLKIFVLTSVGNGPQNLSEILVSAGTLGQQIINNIYESVASRG